MGVLHQNPFDFDPNLADEWQEFVVMTNDDLSVSTDGYIVEEHINIIDRGYFIAQYCSWRDFHHGAF